MLTTKSQSPFTQFNNQYYQNLRRISWEEAEKYRLSVTKWKKDTIDLWARKQEVQNQEITEHDIRWIDKPEKVEEEKKDTIDLTEKMVNARQRDEHQIRQEDLKLREQFLKEQWVEQEYIDLRDEDQIINASEEFWYSPVPQENETTENYAPWNDPEEEKVEEQEQGTTVSPEPTNKPITPEEYHRQMLKLDQNNQ